MVDAGYGRIVNTTSSGVFGLPQNLSYATAKGGVIGMTRSLATAGGGHGLKANLIAPAAMTRMACQGPGEAALPDAGPMASHLLAPIVASLATSNCPTTRETYAAGAAPVALVVLAPTPPPP